MQKKYSEMNTQEQIEMLIQNDMEDIKQEVINGGDTFLRSVLLGENFKPYSTLSADEVSNEFNSRFADELEMESEED